MKKNEYIETINAAPIKEPERQFYFMDKFWLDRKTGERRAE